MFARGFFRGGAALLALVLCMQSVHAEDKQKAREAYRRASQHYDLGEYREALGEFKEAYRQYEDPTFLFNIAQCHRQLNENELAIRFYRTYLIKVPDAPNRVDVRDMIAKLEKAVSEEHANKSAPPQGTMPVDEDKAGHAGATTAPPPATTTSSTPATTTNETLVASAPPPARERAPVYKKWWLWTAVGVVAAAGLGVGLGLGLSHGSTPSATTDLGTYKPGF